MRSPVCLVTEPLRVRAAVRGEQGEAPRRGLTLSRGDPSLPFGFTLPACHDAERELGPSLSVAGAALSPGYDPAGSATAHPRAGCGRPQIRG